MNLEKITLYKEGAKVGALLMLCVLMAAVTAQVVFQPRLLSQAAGHAVKPFLSEMSLTLQETHASVSEVNRLLTSIKDDYDQNRNNLTANAEATTVLIKSLTDTVTDTHTQLFGGQDCRPTAEKLPNGWAKLNCTPVAGLFPQTSRLLSDTHSMMTQLQSDTHDLMAAATTVLGSADDSLKPLKADLEKLGQLEDTLNEDLKAGGKHADVIAQEIQTILAHTDTLLTDPDITAIIANLNKTTKHAGEVMETTDIATRDLRKKVGQVKWIITTISNYLKATIRIY
jgi:hypothetical protein